MSQLDRKTDIVISIILWFSGMVTGATCGFLSCDPSRNDVCETDCHARGFHEGQWSVGHERCSCFNTEFEVQG